MEREWLTNEEVLAMLIDRMNYLQGKFPCRENALVITKLEESLMWLNKRTSDISACCKERQKTVGGYIFVYEKDKNNIELLKNKISINSGNSRKY